MNFLLKYVGGSKMYGLDTPESDTDYRGVYLTEHTGALFGFKDDMSHAGKEDGHDIAYYELRHFLHLLKKTNTAVVEALYNTDWIIFNPAMQGIFDNKDRLLDSRQLFKSLRGYIHSECLTAVGGNTRDLGAKRKEHIAQYGYSPKNFVQLLRLCYAGTRFFNEGYFPTKIMEDDPAFGEVLMNIKLHPERYAVKELLDYKAVMDEELVSSYEKTKIKTTFDTDLAISICKQMYKHKFT